MKVTYSWPTKPDLFQTSNVTWVVFLTSEDAFRLMENDFSEFFLVQAHSALTDAVYKLITISYVLYKNVGLPTQKKNFLHGASAEIQASTGYLTYRHALAAGQQGQLAPPPNFSEI